tara:strand:- start:63 stop:188 length:126 start_codon:yes stop_codon:yes gene_type:complete
LVADILLQAKKGNGAKVFNAMLATELSNRFLEKPKLSFRKL